MRGTMQIEVLGERYQLQDPIGRGGMATIYRGRDLRMDRTVAIKVLREVYSTDSKFVKRFQQEAKAASSLQHPNIVQVYDYGQTEGNYFIVMEYINGTDLRRYLRSRGMLAVDRAIIIAHDVALGLGAAHRRGIVHRDVKPQNVLVGRDGTIKLTDFGIASVYKDINAERLTTTGMTLGTVQYYAPEQAQGEIVSPSADVYALGIVMYEMLTGRTPFDGDTPVAVAMQHIQDLPTPPSHFNPNIPPALEEIILRCLEKSPEMRYSDGSALARALELIGDAEIEEILPGMVTPGLQTATNVPNYADDSMASGTQRPSISSPDNGMGASAFNHQGNNMSRSLDPLVLPHQQLYNAPLESSTGYGTRPRPNAVPHDQRDSRFAGIITVLILLATLLLLGFSIYLAAELGFIHFPGIANPNPTSTNTVLQFPVPDLRGLTYQEALSKATTAGFKLGVSDGNTAGVVIRQAPNPSNLARKGTSIQVKFAVTHQTVVIPAGLVGEPLSVAEQILTNDGIQYSVQPDVNDPNRPANTVSRVSPPSGTSIPKGQNVLLYVVNYTNGTPKVTPEPTATATPRPSPTATPRPSPTATPRPSPTVTPNPSPDPIPDPDPIP